MDIRTLLDCLADLDRDMLQRDAAVRVLLLGALAGEHVLLIGPPGTAKVSWRGGCTGCLPARAISSGC